MLCNFGFIVPTVIYTLAISSRTFISFVRKPCDKTIMDEKHDRNRNASNAFTFRRSLAININLILVCDASSPIDNISELS